MKHVETLHPFIYGRYIPSRSGRFNEVHDPSTGEVIATAPVCTQEEMCSAINAAQAAYPTWRETPIKKRIDLMFRLRDLIGQNMDKLTLTLATEHGKTWSEAAGDVSKAKEMVEFACSASSLLMGESLMNTSVGYDTVSYREPLGVFAGIAPWNFPAMIPMGWMAPLAIVCGNTYVLKPASATPMTSLQMAALYQEAGFPDGVLNVVPCSRKEAEILLSHPVIKGVTFVGSTKVGLHVYATAAANGKRVQALCEAKNHALVLNDAPVTRTAAGIINSSFGCAGERCMALPVIVVQEGIADQLVAELVRLCKQREIGPAYQKTTDLGPLVSSAHRGFVNDWIQKGIDEGATVVLDGRGISVPGYENGYYLGHTILDHVTADMTIGDQEVFGPVLCIKRVKTFEEGLAIMNQNPYANGSVIFTQNGYYAREFSRRTDGGMVGINVGIPVPISIFPFSGHKHSFFGDLHCHGKDAFRFFTESKTITSRWFDEIEAENTKVDTWDGSL